MNGKLDSTKQQQNNNNNQDDANNTNATMPITVTISTYPAAEATEQEYDQ